MLLLVFNSNTKQRLKFVTKWSAHEGIKALIDEYLKKFQFTVFFYVYDSSYATIFPTSWIFTLEIKNLKMGTDVKIIN